MLLKISFFLLVASWVMWLAYVYQAAHVQATGGIFEIIIFYGSILCGLIVFVPLGKWIFGHDE